MEFRISIDAFDGPLDLMLHLIRENKLDIFDLDIVVLCDQYMEYLHNMEEMHLDIASEYIEELATLVEYKSKKLLPRNEEVMEENYEEDQTQKLVSRLLEYQKYKEASELLEERFEKRNQLYGRDVASVAKDWSKVQEVSDLGQLSVYDLSKAMKRIVRRQVLLNPYQTQVTVKEISIEERRSEILQRFGHESISFSKLCADCTQVRNVIITFLAVLECIHEKQLSFTQSDGEIWLKREGEHGG